ncbi:SHPS1 phosphatase, partial [Rhynochetos jubatus]|nr:SHPS1 phosphatase [Rhynochetos jubatus]
GAQEHWDFQLRQPQAKVSVTVGETFTLTCTVSGSSPTGPLKWLKGWGSENETIYNQTGSFPRVTRAVSESNTDFSIHIRDFHPEDAGTYYCVKFRKALRGGDEVFRRGGGTAVSLYEPTVVASMVATTVVLCVLLLGLFLALWMYRRKRRGNTESQCLARPGQGIFSPIPLQCCAGTPSNEILDAETSHMPSQQSSGEDNDIHYADLQPLPTVPPHGRNPGAACSEYASIRVAAK